MELKLFISIKGNIGCKCAILDVELSGALKMQPRRVASDRETSWCFRKTAVFVARNGIVLGAIHFLAPKSVRTDACNQKSLVEVSTRGISCAL